MIPRKIGTKKIAVISSDRFLNNWFERPACTEIFPPFKSALNQYDGRIFRDKKPMDGFGDLMSATNDVMNVGQKTALFSSVSGATGIIAITPATFEKSMIMFWARRIVQHTWHNHNDQLLQPSVNLSDDFITDCVVYGLFEGKNQTASLKDVVYKGTTYQIRNQFFPYLLSELREWETPHDLSGQIRTAQETFVANWLKGRILSAEAQALLDAGRKVYQVFYKEWKNLNLRKFKIENYDCGWYQIRNALLDAKIGLEELNAVKMAHTKLAEKLRPKVYEYGFLDQEILYT